MIITIAHGAGSRAKSIVADNLAALRTLSGSKLILLDNDARHASLNWSIMRRYSGTCTPVMARQISGKGMQAELENLRFHYHDIVIDAEARDCMGSRSALLAAHVTILVIDLDQIDQLQEAELSARMQIAQAANPRMRTLIVMSCEDAFPAKEKVLRVRNFVSQLRATELFPHPILCSNGLNQAYEQGLAISEYQAADQEVVYGMTELFSMVFTTH
ncbi:hypothetical protein [Undibacterium umbellatum]|uniref:Uncharacterized protein n=1 Tax=Undibacterium umbellatum TaxID=2762300 RepID=A0ABR6ZB56_9BURK|nr:hypothetical protein [Undibacterium umbellatum]MBC3908816.1 hypothetical protein [Undibacterium umbellatum]